jgi:hypothetical protein
MQKSLSAALAAVALAGCAPIVDYSADVDPPAISLEIPGGGEGGAALPVYDDGGAAVDCRNGTILRGRLAFTTVPPASLRVRVQDESSGVAAVTLTIAGAEIGQPLVQGAGAARVTYAGDGGEVRWTPPFMIEPLDVEFAIPLDRATGVVEVYANARDAAGRVTMVGPVRVGTPVAHCAAAG